MLKVVGVGYCDSYETVGPSLSLDTPPHESNLLVSDQLTIKPDTVPSCRSARRSGLRRSTAVTYDQHKELPLLIRQRGTHGLSRLHKSKASPTSALHRAPLQRIPLSSSAINLSGISASVSRLKRGHCAERNSKPRMPGNRYHRQVQWCRCFLVEGRFVKLGRRDVRPPVLRSR